MTVGPMTRNGECKKFSPNIFNKSKCTNCFRQKEEHSAEALESNRATRKAVKCGYLFVAPGRDFTNPINRTKRWQRRWFVLFDDGELIYSLDEHPDTVPQARLDMFTAVAVEEADEATGNPHSLAVTSSDRSIHFVRGACREEAKGWKDVLTSYMRHTTQITPTTNGGVPKHKRNSTFPGPNTTSGALNGPVVVRATTISTSTNLTSHQQQTTGWVTSAPSVPDRDQRPRSSTAPVIVATVPTNKTDRKIYSNSPPTREKVRTDDNVRLRSSEQHRSNSSLSQTSSSGWDQTDSTDCVTRRLLIEEYESECKLKEIADSITRLHPRNLSNGILSKPRNMEPTRDSDITNQKQVRGDPDGCGLDLSLRYSPSSELRVDLPTEDLLNIKKGWLMKQGSTSDEWNKHWFVLRGSALLFYRDPTAEDQGILDGVVDLSCVTTVNEVQVNRNYGFQTISWDDKKVVLSAITSGIRTNWVSAIRRSAGLTDENIMTKPSLDGTLSSSRSIVFSSDDEYRTASECGRRESSDWGDTLPPSPPLNRTPISKVKERARGGPRSRIFTGGSLASKRSKSSPPVSPRSISESSKSDELLLSSCAESDDTKSDRSSLVGRVGKQTDELDDVKKQLTSVLCQLSNAEQELIRLRQRKHDVLALQKQVETMGTSLKMAEDMIKQKSDQLMEFDSMKKIYRDEKKNWETAMCSVQDESEKHLEELERTREQVSRLRDTLSDVSDRLARGIEENESLYRRVRELEGRSVPINVSIRDSRARSLDSLSDLTNIDLDLDTENMDKERIIEEYEDLRCRFEKAVQEIRAMKRELRESNIQTDCLELELINARQDLQIRQQTYEAQASMMAARIQDLTTKLTAADKQIRLLKSKLTKSEGREKRRSLSLKGRESFTICKELEEKLVDLEKKIGKLDTTNGNAIEKSDSKDTGCRASTVASRLRRKSLDSATSSEPMKVLIRMTSLENRVADMQKANSDTMNIIVEDGIDTKEAEICKIECAWRTKMSEIASKRRKLQSEGCLDDEAKTTLLAEKVATESVFLNKLRHLIKNDIAVETTNRIKSRLDSSIDLFAEVDKIVGIKNNTEKRVKEFMDNRLSVIQKYKWDADEVKTIAYDCLENIVTDTEMHMALDYYFKTQDLSDKGSVMLIQCVMNRGKLETWLNEVRNSIEIKIDEVLQTLPIKGKRTEEKSCLEEYFEVAVLHCMLESGLNLVEKTPTCKTDMDESEALSECQYLAAKMCQCLPPVDDKRMLHDSLGGVETEVMALRSCMEEIIDKRQLNGPVSDPQPLRNENKTTSWIEDVCNKCHDLRMQIASLQMYLAQCQECQRCVYLQEKIKGYEQDRDVELEAVNKRHQMDVAELKSRLEEEKRKLSAINDQEQNVLKDRVKKLEKRLSALDSEYSQQMDNLRLSYQISLASNDSSNNVMTEESTKMRYQTEIEHLRALCEKGLLAMENSHRRIIVELEEKHRQETESLKLEKEQALAEETHATLAALDAMRKAHEAEVQKEVTKFKTEFLKKIQSNHDIGALHKEHEAEMEEIKKEILSLSEKYSIKCVESANLEEELKTANSQLAQAQQQIIQLDSRNKQLRAHLVSEANDNISSDFEITTDPELGRLKQDILSPLSTGHSLHQKRVT
ncbi:protein outspread-like isoform X2 [Rhopalosiphum padi]|uniref:protein outspread-like isoform X2 n=1 Tax=Rhopalosiphum padi TaxID=40932 RepID=UPI00298E9BAA|nr:protein outspread-like isoform X2 [Rhopalosiphum padi]